MKSAIAWPPDKTKLPAGGHADPWLRVDGSGFGSAGGDQLRRRRSLGSGQARTAPKPFSWVRWNYLARCPGDHVLMSRATDDAGRSQPLQRQAGRKDGYELNFCAPVRCSVR